MDLDSALKNLSKRVALLAEINEKIKVHNE